VRADVFVGVLSEALQVMSLLQVKLLKVFVLLLLKVSLLKGELFSLLSPQTETTMTHPCGA
jgi:hypothetical protein